MMSHMSLRIINEEHAALNSMLLSILLMIKRGPDKEPELFFDILRAMLFYIDEVPEKQPCVAKKSSKCAEAVDRLNKEHQKGESSIRELQHLLLAWEIMGDSRRLAFETSAKHYVDFYKEHMHLEESVVIPEALEVLSSQDWKSIDSEFVLNSDPLSSYRQRDPVYDRLFTKITLKTPAPIGLG
jgi:hemerythrin-like domain-containing protein